MCMLDDKVSTVYITCLCAFEFLYAELWAHLLKIKNPFGRLLFSNTNVMLFSRFGCLILQIYLHCNRGLGSKIMETSEFLSYVNACIVVIGLLSCVAVL